MKFLIIRINKVEYLFSIELQKVAENSKFSPELAPLGIVLRSDMGQASNL